jgi:opacity protein-like surface antigen
MKKMLVTAGIVLALLPLASAQDVKQQEEQQKAMAAYMKAAAVTENHQFLAKYAGDWDVEVTYWTAPGAPPARSSATFKAASRLGGRYVMMDFNGVMMGQPFAGIWLVGFDNLEQKYNTLWIDNTSTSFFITQGTREGGVISESGSWPDPVSGRSLQVKARTTWISDDEFRYEQFMVLADGAEHKGMEFISKRRK